MVFPVPCMMYWTAMAATITAKTLVTIIDPRCPSNLFIEPVILRIKVISIKEQIIYHIRRFPFKICNGSRIAKGPFSSHQ
jgi:hypothetical protein